MFKNLTNKIKSLFKINDRENIKDVLEDLIEDNKNGQDKIDDGTKNIFKNVINLSNKCIEDVMIPRQILMQFHARLPTSILLVLLIEPSIQEYLFLMVTWIKF